MRISSAFLILLCASTTLSMCTGVRIDLKHVDADANLTAAERVRRAGVRLHRRLELLSGAAVPITSWGYGEYIAQYSMCEPPQAVQGIIDTNNALVWTQCKTCRPNCFSQNLDYYDFSVSTTGGVVPCNSSLCVDDNEYEKQRCAGDTCTVRANYDYGAVSTGGVLRREQFTFGSTKASIAFGCITETNMSREMPLDGASGLVGLAYGDLSLVNQLGATRFSYCLTGFFTDHHVNSSALFVGPSAGLNLSGGAPVTSAPYSKPTPSSPFYSLLVSGLSVGEAGLKIPSEALGSNVIMDCTFPFMSLADAAYKELTRELSRQLRGRLQPPPVDWMELCVSQLDVSSLVPPLVIHFGTGDLVLPPDNYWAPVGGEVSCMLVINSGSSMTPPMNQTTIIGTYMQQDMHVLYDLDSHHISFQKADCHNI